MSTIEHCFIKTLITVEIKRKKSHVFKAASPTLIHNYLIVNI